MVVGLSAFGRDLPLVIMALIIMKAICKAPQSQRYRILCGQTEVKDETHVNQAFEVSDMSDLGKSEECAYSTDMNN